MQIKRKERNIDILKLKLDFWGKCTGKMYYYYYYYYYVFIVLILLYCILVIVVIP